MAKKKEICNEDLQSRSGGLYKEFIESGQYGKMKEHQATIDTIKGYIKGKLSTSSEKRHVYEKHGLVAKWVAKPIYDTDYLALNEYLYEVGLLHLVAKVNPGDEDLSAFALPKSNYIRTSLNKQGKEYLSDRGIIIQSQEIVELLPLYKHSYDELKKIEQMYERIKQEMYQCKRLIENKKIETPFGKISLLENKVEYDPVALLKEKGPEWLIEHSSPNMSKLDNLVDEGRLTPNDILQFRTVLDTRLDFMVMSLESEKKALQMFDWKKSKRIANSIKPTQKDVREVYIDKAMILLEEDCSKLQETAVLDYLLDFSLVAERVYELFDADKEITGPIMSDFIEQADIFIQEKYGIGVFGFDERAVLYSVNEAYDQNGVRITDNFFQSFKSNDFYESNNRRWAQIMRNSLWSKARNTLNIPKENNEQLNLFDDLIG